MQAKVAALAVALTACAPYLPRLAQEDATVIVRCSDREKSSQLIVVLLDHSKGVEPERQLQKIAEIEIDSSCHFKVRAP